MSKANVLVVGTGGVGTMAAYALETGGKTEVTAVFRSNFYAVKANGISIDSIEHGQGIKGWRPTHITAQVPNVSHNTKPFDFIVVTTKNIPDVPPTVAEIIEPAVTPGHTAIALVQNGLNIEKPLIAKFPNNVILSGVSLIGATEITHGHIRHDDSDVLLLGDFPSPQIPKSVGKEAAERFIQAYNACGKVDCKYDADVMFSRWRKLVYNGTFNAVATILRMDTSRMRIYDHVIEDLIRPAMKEVVIIASAAGVKLPDDIIDYMINVDPLHTFFKPSMCQDVEKGNYMEVENIVGELTREADRLEVPAPVLKTLYGILRGLQVKIKEERGMMKPEYATDSKYLK